MATDPNTIASTIDASIQTLSEKAGHHQTSGDSALKYTQAALNLAHVRATYNNLRDTPKAT
jgi:hypothetical protein